MVVRVAASLAAAALLGLAGCASDSRNHRGLPQGSAVLVLREHHVRDPHGAVFIEGAEQIAVVRHGSASMQRRLPATLRVTPGTYELESATRVCDANCGNLDAPSLQCKAQISAPAHVTVTTFVKRRCVIDAPPATQPGTPVASPHDASSIAAFAIDDDPPAGGLSTRCKFQGIASNQDVYMCRARYEGDRITLRLEHDRHGPAYRVTVLSDARELSFIGTVKRCTLSRNPNCPQ